MEDGEQSARRRFIVGALQIDPERCTVSGHGSPSDLTPRAEALLLQLARSPNALVTQEQILQTVWAGRIVEEAVISNCVWQIRKALGPEGKNILQNRAKRGYVLLVPDSAWIVESSPTAELPAAEPMPARVEAEDPSVDEPDEAKAVGISPLAPESESQSEPQSELQPEPHATLESVPAAVGVDGIGADPPIGFQRRSRVTWRRMVVAAVVLICLGGGGWLWRSKSDASGAQTIAQAGSGTGIPLGPDAEMTVSVQVPDRMDWLRSAVLATAVEQAYRRDAHVLYFEKPQTRNPFAGPHLEVQVRSADANAITAELTLTHAQSQLRDSYTGPAQNLSKPTEQFLARHLQAPLRESTAASDILVTGIVADLQFDVQTALTEYRRALARDPALVEATLAMASTLIRLGRSRDALGLLTGSNATKMSTQQRCLRSLLIAEIAPESLKGNECEEAIGVSKLEGRESQKVLRSIDGGGKIGAGRWLRNQHAEIDAHLNLQQLDETEYTIGQAQRIAADAGWERARIEVGAYRGRLALHQGRMQDAIKAYLSSSSEIETLKSIPPLLAWRTMAIRLQRPIPGPMTGEQRLALQGIVDLARQIGSPRGEIDALQILARLDRDDVPTWQSHLDRIEKLIQESYTPKAQIQERHFILNELLGQRRYREVIDGVDRLQRAGATDTQAQIWNLTLKAESYFPNDQFDAAIVTVDAMEKENFDIAETSPCLFAWLFVEADQLNRSALMLKKCPYSEYDRFGRAARGDYGLLATARLSLRQDSPGRAWAVLRPRIDELLKTPDLTRQEAESLTMLARHAVAMPGADRIRLSQALRIASELAGKDGAGPNLRFGVHTLRWRLCLASGRSDCGPALPAWAQEDRLEARLAQDYANGL
jgi:DNA-binding winged helix-turn-helix (wHTH) protein